jgi:uncharacterized protein (DUF427 family)
MSLTFGPGPLASRPPGAFNFGWDGVPAHRLFFDAYPRRMRALVGDRVVLDTVRGRLLHESNHLPKLYVPFEDLDGELLERSERTTHCPFKGDASYWSLRAGDRVIPDAVWAYEEPIAEGAWLKGFASLYWDKPDAWFAENERLFGHLRDPYHRVDVVEASRPVTVTAHGTVIAESSRAKLLYETSVQPRVYVPGGDVIAGALVPSETRTSCPYKGEASYWTLQVDGHRIEDAAWSYEAPLNEALEVARHVSFDAEGVEVELAEPADRFALAVS